MKLADLSNLDRISLSTRDQQIVEDVAYIIAELRRRVDAKKMKNEDLIYAIGRLDENLAAMMAERAQAVERS